MAQRVLVLGGSGFLGGHVVAKLSGDGHDVVVLTRRRTRARDLFLLPTVRVVEGDAHDPATLARWTANATAVINLIGTLHEHGRDTFERVHVDVPRTLVAACRDAGISRVLHVSALAAGSEAASAYLRSKAAGEAVIAESGLGWTIFRPSVIFGRGDSFLNLFAKLAQMFPVIPLACARARFQPVFVGDVAECIARALVGREGPPRPTDSAPRGAASGASVGGRFGREGPPRPTDSAPRGAASGASVGGRFNDGTIGQRYPLCGPKAYTLEELVNYVAETSGHPRPILPLGPALANLQARVMELLPGPLLTRDNLASMQHDSVCDGPFPRAFDITPTPVEAIAPEYLAPIALRSRFDTFRSQSGR